MDVALYSTLIQARVMRDREGADAAYQRFPDTTAYWAFLDLAKSTNFRLTHGPRLGYVRSETFFSLVRETIQASGEITLVKEIGDSVFLTSPTFRPLLESTLLIDQTSRQISSIASVPDFPFDIRAVISAGTCKKLTRHYVDYLGTAIDQAARLMGVRSQSTNFLLHADVYHRETEIIREYASFLTVSEQWELRLSTEKAVSVPIHYHELFVKFPEMAKFKDHFSAWRTAAAPETK